MQDLDANPLDYEEGGICNDRRLYVTSFLDTTNPDLNPVKRAGGKLLVIIGTNDTRASPGAQLDHYQTVVDAMGQASIDEFARMWVLPMTNNGLGGSAVNVNGNGEPNSPFGIPNSYDRVTAIVNRVENGVAPPLDPVVTDGPRSLPMCRYPTHPGYLGGDLPVTQASSYECASPATDMRAPKLKR